VPHLAPDDEIPAEVLEFFVPEVEEHLQTITDCLLALEANPNEEDIHRLFRSMHTIKGSAAQVGWQRISTIAHRAEDLVGRLRDGELKPSATIIDLCLESVDVLKKLIYRQWEDEAGFQFAARTLIARLDHIAPAESESPAAEVPPLEAVPPLELAVAAEIAPVSPPPPLSPLEASFVSQPVETGSEQREEPKVETPEPASASRLPVGIGQSKSVRIALERLDRMMNAVGELVINRTRMLGRLAELEKLAEVLNFSKGRMSDKVTEFQDKYEFSRINSAPLLSSTQWPGSALEHHAGGYGFGGPGAGGSGFHNAGYGNQLYGNSGYGSSFDASHSEFSELEMDRYDDFGILSRSLTEISADITEVLTQLDGFVRRVDGDIDEFTKLAHRLQDEITQARMVPIGNLFTRISRTVRDASKASNKQVELTLAGAETELDNNIIQQIADPLLHLVRNAVAHGIERADERYEAGKADQGNIAVRAYHKGNHIYIEVEDDGRGVDFERVKATAVEGGFLSTEEAEGLNRRELVDLLFRPGFSTAPRRTELAGRGVGLDVVRSNITNLNGEIEVETEKGIGSRFTLKVPLTLIISQALFVQCGEQTFAFPLGYVEEIRRIRASEIEEVGGKLITKVRDVLTEVVRFDEALQLPRLAPINGYFRLVLVNIGGRQVGVVVEEVLRKDEIVIKSLGEYLHNVKLFPGATIAPDGSLILLVDVSRLIMGESIERRPLTTMMNAARLFLPGATAVARGEIPAAAVDAVGKEKLVVLADDSISVRKFVGRMLEKAGYRVKLAADGLEALEIATSNDCDLVITDLEMPRTNGYELMLHLRQTPSTSKVPVMVVTSRAGAKHRERALKEGALAFMVKPVQEESFIAQVVELIGTSGQVAAAPPVVH
jgi:chemosensory pili system protein ChpA (sensor histidine kinase/response regulator)